MPSLFALKIISLIAITTWLAMTFVVTKNTPDWRKGELIVALPPAGLDVDADFELELATLFAQQLHVKIKPVAMDFDQLAKSFDKHRIHMAATGMRSNASSTLRFSAPFQTLSEQIVCKGDAPKHLADLVRRNLTVITGSAQEEALRTLAGQIPKLHWTTRHGQSVSDLLKEVAEEKLDCTVANEEQIALARNFYPQLGDEFDLKSPSHLAWAFAADVDTALFDAVQKFIEDIKKDGTLSHLIDRHYGHNERLDALDAITFVSKARMDLPHYRQWFEEAAMLTGIEWQLLAALAYQESHWNPHAASFTNVRGMMMLTSETADRMNLANRLDAHASIIAGAQYLQMLKDSLPERINDKERTWLALAAYNQGMGHLEDARVLAEKSGLNPDVWSDVRKVMPLLSRPAYYEQCKHGQARGGEAVILVETVRLYHDMLNRLEKKDIPRLPPSPSLGLFPFFTKKSNSP